MNDSINAWPNNADKGSEDKAYNHISMQNERGEWVPALPEPFYGFRKRCDCGAKFWTKKAYQAHYALEHIVLGRFPL